MDLRFSSSINSYTLDKDNIETYSLVFNREYYSSLVDILKNKDFEGDGFLYMTDLCYILIRISNKEMMGLLTGNNSYEEITSDKYQDIILKIKKLNIPYIQKIHFTSNVTNPITGQCIICLDNSKECEVTLNCRHSFHLECLVKWVLNINICPICKIFI